MTIESKDGAPELHASSNDMNNSSSIDTVTDDFTNMAVLDDNNDTVITICANCGKEEDEDNSLKFCGACKLVKYCSAECQKAHRPMHKRECKRRTAELYDKKLFKEPPPPEECPLCMVPLPLDTRDSIFKICCGKIICHGCIYAMQMIEGKDLCAFCRCPPPNSKEESIKSIRKLMGKGIAEAFVVLAGYHAEGRYGMPQDYRKANELWLKAGELGCGSAYYNLGLSYEEGRGAEVDKKKAKHYYELAAMGGSPQARYNLGYLEECVGDYHRAMSHLILAARAGHEGSLDMVKKGFMVGMVTKDEYANTLRSYQKIQDEMKSDERDKAASEMKSDARDQATKTN